jgi:putative phosphoesterase
MKTAIISDVHNNEVNLKKVLDFCMREGIKTIVCCGDLASKETLDFLCDNFSEIILYTFGNADYDDLRELVPQKKYRNAHLFENFGEAIVEKKNVAFVHFPDKAKSLARTGKYDFIFYGHTHKPWINKARADANQKEYTLLNPGTTAGEIYPPTFAVWNNENDDFQLIRIHELR